MFAQFLSVVLVNTYSWVGGQGYCSFDFALYETEAEYRNLEIILRPEFDPANTATARTELDDVSINIENLGGDRFNWANTAKVESDCNITGFDIIKATALVDDNPADLLGGGKIEIQTYKPLPISVGGK